MKDTIYNTVLITGPNEFILQKCLFKYIHKLFISNTNEDKTHFKDHLYFDRLVGLLQGE